MPFTLQEKLDAYRKTLIQVVITKLEHLAKVEAGLAAAEEDFGDKTLSLAKFWGFGLVDNFASNVPGMNFVTGGLEYVADWFNEYRKKGGIEHAAKQFTVMTKKGLHILLKEVAFDASRFYEWFIAARLPDDSLDSVEFFAKKAAARMVNCIKREKLALTKENLLLAIIKGPSGGLVDADFLNDELIVKNPQPKMKYTAEGAYGRPLIKKIHSDGTSSYHALIGKDKAAHKQKVVSQNPPPTPPSPGPNNNNNVGLWQVFKEGVQFKFQARMNYGYTKTIVWDKLNNKHDPKYGIVIAPQSIIDALKYVPMEAEPTLQFSQALQQEIAQNPLTLQNVTFQDFDAYAKYLGSLRNQNDNNNNNNTPAPIDSFIDFLKARAYPNAQVLFFSPDDPNEYDLTTLDLSSGNFANCILNNCKFGNISSANFSHATLIRADFTQANAAKANFFAASMECINADQSNHQNNTVFAGADLKQAKLHFANLTKANIRGAKLLAVELAGAILESIEEDDIGELIKLQTNEEENLIKLKSILEVIDFEVRKLEADVKNIQDTRKTRMQN